jgi:prevent-host-death family protein
MIAPMKTTTSVSEIKARLSAFLRRVQAGETITILSRGKPIAELGPPRSVDEEEDARLARLERAGVIRRSKVWPPDLKGWLRDHPPIPLKPGFSVLECLLEEREEGR